MDRDSPAIWIGRGCAGDTPAEVSLLGAMANRHGLIAGATGTGKTVTLQTLAEGFSMRGVPVFLADVKGDLAGLSAAGGGNAKVSERLAQLGLADRPYTSFPTVCWDLWGEQGHPIRTTVSEMGPLLLSRLLDLNETQAGVLQVVFRYADDEGLLLLDLKDLREALAAAAEHARELSTRYGNVSPASVGTIQRGLLTLEKQGGDLFFGEPALDIGDLFAPPAPGERGTVHILAADRLLRFPRLYATFLLYLLSELFEQLPEVGDRPLPKLVFFFDEAHLLFTDLPKAVLEKVEQVVRLIRSKGVGVYFVTQTPQDIPDPVLGQLGNKFQHALRAFTLRDRRAVQAAAEAFAINPALDTARVVTELGVGEALVSTLDARGAPRPVERVRIVPPQSRIGPIDAAERREVMRRSPLAGKYDHPIDRQSAYETLTERATRRAASAPAPAPSRGRETLWEATAKSTVRAIGSSLGRQIVRGLLGSLFGRRR